MVYMCHIYPIQSIINGHLGWFQVFAIVNSATINICVHVSLWKNDIYSFGYIASNEIAGRIGNSVLSSFRNCQTAFHNGRTNLHSQIQCVSVVFLYNFASMCFFFDFNNCHYDWCEMLSHCNFDWHFSNDQWCWAFFIWLLVAYMSCFEKCLFMFFAHFLMGCFSLINLISL